MTLEASSSTARPEVDDLPKGALYMCGAALTFAAMGALIKVASATLPNVMVVFARNATGLAILVPVLFLQKGPVSLATRDVPGHLLRGLAGLASMYCFFFAIAHLKLADAVLLNQSLPLFLPIVASLLLKEAVPPRLWKTLVVGFLGMALVVKPGLGVFSTAALLGACSALLAAVAQVGVRRLTRTEPVSRIVFYFSLIATLGSALPLPFAWKTPEPKLWPVLLATGVFATVGQVLLTKAYSSAPAARVGPFVYTGVVFAGVLDWAVWGALPDALSVAGAGLILSAAILSLRVRPAEAVAEA